MKAILAVAERWGPIDRSHRKLAHRGSYQGLVWVAPSTFRRVLAAHGLVLPEPAARTPSVKKPWPDLLEWAPNRVWIYDATHFGRARRVVFAIVDMVSRRWIDTLVSVEESASQAQVIFEHALEIEGLLDVLTANASTSRSMTRHDRSCWRSRTTGPRWPPPAPGRL